jgi:hypothetical protein
VPWCKTRLVIAASVFQASRKVMGLPRACTYIGRTYPDFEVCLGEEAAPCPRQSGPGMPTNPGTQCTGINAETSSRGLPRGANLWPNSAGTSTASDSRRGCACRPAGISFFEQLNPYLRKPASILQITFAPSRHSTAGHHATNGPCMHDRQLQQPQQQHCSDPVAAGQQQRDTPGVPIPPAAALCLHYPPRNRR